MAGITSKPKQVVKRLLSALPVRAKDVLVGRYGLGVEPKKITLEAIGRKYGITRERVRQIENYAISVIRKSPAYAKESPVIEELEKELASLGGVMAEEDLLNHLAKDKATQNSIHFLLVVGHPFKREREDESFRHRWYTDDVLAKKVHEALHRLHKNLDDKALLSDLDIIEAFLKHVDQVSDFHRKDEIVRRWLSLSKVIGRNPLGEWGLCTSPAIRAKGVRDYAFLVLRKHGSPIHFRDVAKSIEKLFGKNAHVATTHNELIKDPRFVLVGRGLYALSEWGYMSGVVRDVIKKIIDKNGPLTKKEIVERVMKERYVKENTILVNLHNQKYFKKDKEGKYHIVSK